MADQLTSTPEPPPPASLPSGRPRLDAAAVSTWGGLVVLLDAAVETFLAGAPVRWWVVAGAAIYAVATALTWRVHVRWPGRLALAGVSVLVVVGATAWWPEGLTHGVRVAGQPTARVMSLLAATGVGLAGIALVRFQVLPRFLRLALGAIAAYGVAAFALGAVSASPLDALLRGHSVWQGLPTVLQGAFLGGLVVLPLGLVSAIVRAGLRRPPEGSFRETAWNVAAIATSLGIVLAGLPMRAGAPAVVSPQSTATPASGAAVDLAASFGADPNARRLSPDALNATLADSFRAIEDGERDAQRDRWDASYVAAAPGSDPERIFSWVQTHTGWIPYRGLLRGSTGVLMDRLGNSLDRAALLATLLQQSGRTVRLAHGSLQPDQAVLLLPTLLRARGAAMPPSGTVEAAADLSTAAVQYQLDETSVRRVLATASELGTQRRMRLDERVPEQARRLATAAGALGPSSAPAVPPQTSNQKALTAAWIEYTIGRPGEQPRTLRRSNFDLIGPAARAARSPIQPQLDEASMLRRGLALFRETEILPVICRLAPQYVTHLVAGSVLASRGALNEALRSDAPDDFGRIRELARDLTPMPSPLYALALARFEWSRVADSIYIDEPNILTRHTFFTNDGHTLKLLVATDIVSNEVGVDLTAEDPFGPPRQPDPDSWGEPRSPELQKAIDKLNGADRNLWEFEKKAADAGVTGGSLLVGD